MEDEQYTDTGTKAAYFDSLGWDAAAEHVRETETDDRLVSSSIEDEAESTESDFSLVSDLSADERAELTDLDTRLEKHLKNGNEPGARIMRSRRARLFGTETAFPDYDAKIAKCESIGWDAAAAQLREQRGRLAGSA